MSGTRSGSQRRLKGGKGNPERRSSPEPSKGYMIGGTVPWPTFGDGTEWRDALDRVRHRDAPQEVGKIDWVEWCHPDGGYMPVRDKVRKATKTKPERVEPYPGAWYAVVNWDRRDQHDSVKAKCLLENLEPE